MTPSVGNFVLMHFPDAPGRSAADADAFLTERGLILRGVAAYGLPDALRRDGGGAEEANAASWRRSASSCGARPMAERPAAPASPSSAGWPSSASA